MSTADSSILHKLYYRWLLRPLGLDYQTSSVFWILMFLGVVTLGGYWYLENVYAVLGLVMTSVVVFVSFMRPDYSLYALLGLVLLFDQYGIPNFPSYTTEIHYFKNIQEIPYLPLGGIVFNLIELHFGLLILALFLWVAVKKDFKLRPIPAWPLFTFFFVTLVGAFMYGISTGGDMLTAMWEIRALFYLCLLYLIVPQIIQTKQQIRALFWVFIICITVKALQGGWRFVELGFTTGGFETLTNHEDPVFTTTLVVLMLGFLAYRVRGSQFWGMLLLLLPLAFGFYVAQRRAAYAGAMVSVAAFFVLLPAKTRRKVMKGAIPIGLLLIVYVAAFWNSDNRFARPVELVKTGLSEPTIEENYEEYSSNLYRDMENYNLAQTVANNPVGGVGFGNEYEQPVELVNINFSLQEYVPHNQIYWVLTKMGIIGFLAFWFFFNGYAAKGVKVFLQMRDPYLKSISLVVVIAVINQMVVSFFDLQLTYYRNMIYLGTLMGLLSTLERLSKENSEEQSKEYSQLEPHANFERAGQRQQR